MIVPGPVAMIAAGAVFLLAAVMVLVQQRRIVEVVPRSNVTINVPAKWDDGEITRLLLRHQDQPAVLSHAVSSIRSRLIMGQDLKTAQRRLKLIASVIEVFKLNREMQGILQDIHLAEKEFEIRQVEADTRLEDAQGRQKSEGVLRQLRAQRDELQLQKEITQIKAETGAIQQSVKPQGQQLTAEQQRANDKAACEARIQALKDEKQKALNLDDAAERIMRVNALDDAIQREYERWSKLV
jgi:hypothetical protein